MHRLLDSPCARTEWKTRGHDDAPGLQEALRLDRVLPPILERSGLVKVSTTTPYHWRR